MQTIDLRSDTITQPTQAMRDAMRDAEVGDDVLGDDPTVNRLQEEAARTLGMEAALFVPSGTMANQIAAWVHTARHGAIVAEENSHLALYEGGGAALLAGAHLRTVAAQRGVFGPGALDRFWFPDDPHFATTKMIAIENTHNWHGGTIWTPEEVVAIQDTAHGHGAMVHMDGARLWHAAIARDQPETAWTDHVDSVMCCLSKGLSAPVGSVLAGNADFIHKARTVRKVLGGGMRQAGIIAAAGLEALTRMRDRLSEDHANATTLASALQDLPGLELLGMPETNIVYCDVAASGMSAAQFVANADAVGVRCLFRDAGSVVRFVTHRHVSRADMEEAAARLQTVVSGAAAGSVQRTVAP